MKNVKILLESNIDFKESENVEIKSLNNYCKNSNIDYINLLKMDVEGHELDVLQGGQELFAKNAIDIATFEFGGCNIDSRTFFQDFWYFFKGYDMEIYRILPREKLYKIKEYKETNEQFITTNYLAIHKNLDNATQNFCVNC